MRPQSLMRGPPLARACAAHPFDPFTLRDILPRRESGSRGKGHTRVRRCIAGFERLVAFSCKRSVCLFCALDLRAGGLPRLRRRRAGRVA